MRETAVTYSRRVSEVYSPEENVTSAAEIAQVQQAACQLGLNHAQLMSCAANALLPGLREQKRSKPAE